MAGKKKPPTTNLPLKDAIVNVFPEHVALYQGLPPIDNSRFRMLGNWEADPTYPITWPPAQPISEVFQNRAFPVGQILNQKDIKDFAHPVMDVELLRQAAEAHRVARRYLQSIVQPGMKMIDIVSQFEAVSSTLMGGHSLQAGWAFPTGCSLNNCAAHYTPNPGDNLKLSRDHVCKFDFGLHVNGCLVDSAFTIAFDPDFDPLVEASREGTNAGISAAGPDALLGDIGAAIQEVIESYEMTRNGKTLKIRAIRNLTGHSIEAYRIHAGKSLPNIAQKNTERMLEGEIFACETFATTGKGYVQDDLECSHFMKNPMSPFVPLRLQSAKELLKLIDKRHGTLAFCRRWLDDAGCTRHLMALRNLVDAGIVLPYPPLSDVPNSYTSQFEHTIVIKSSGTEVLTRGSDY